MLKRIFKKPLEKSIKTLEVAPKESIFVPKSSYEQCMADLYEKAQVIKGNCEDYLIKDVPVSNLTMSLSMDKPLLTFIPDGDTEESEWRLTKLAESQLCTKLGMNVQYYRKLLGRNEYYVRNLAMQNINTLAEYHDGSLFIRTYQNYVRGVLSDRYACFDTDGIISVLADSLKNKWKDDIKVRGYYQDFEKFHFRFTSTTPVKGLDDKDLFFGLQITSSDVGLSPLSIRFIVFKKVCTNGLCIPTLNSNLFTHKHIGITAHQFRDGAEHSFKTFPTLAEMASNALKVAEGINLRNSDLYVHGKEDNRQQEAVREYLKLSQKDMVFMTEIAEQKYPRTLWGYANAITEYSQRFSIERRLELEELAGGLLVNYKRFGISA